MILAKRVEKEAGAQIQQLVGLGLISLIEMKNSHVSVNIRSTESTVKDGVSNALIIVYQKLDKIITLFNTIDKF